MTHSFDRRNLLRGATVAGLTGAWMAASTSPEHGVSASESESATEMPKEQSEKLTDRKAKVEWPYWDEEEAKNLLRVLNTGKWGRTSGGSYLKEFESTFAERMKSKYCLATSSGTTALMTTLGALGVGPGDEVILPPYTFVASFNSITSSYALPIFVDSDLETFQIDSSKLDAKINEQTKVLMPVHIGGSVADLDALIKIGQSKNVPVIEDACQAPFAEWRGAPVGTQGLGGCFSFQASKNITAGEGGAVLTNDEGFANRCYNFHTPGGGKAAPSLGRGANFRLTEFQASLLLAQMTRSEEQVKRREENANYLTQLLQEISGIHPAKLTTGCSRSAWHLYMFRYDKKEFGDRSRALFLKELASLGIGASAGYSSLNRSTHVVALASNPHYQKVYGKKRMEEWSEENRCPVNDRLCEEAVWFTQSKLLGTKQEMEKIAQAIRKVQSTKA